MLYVLNTSAMFYFIDSMSMCGSRGSPLTKNMVFSRRSLFGPSFASHITRTVYEWSAGMKPAEGTI